jgi:hypothetical protein
VIAGHSELASGLRTAQRRLGSLELAPEERIQWQRRLTAICDAMKSPSADTVRGARRLSKFMAELDRADPHRT